MANPQTENGHIDIANELMDALALTRIPGEARQVLDFIIRKTYGWHKKEDIISLSQFVEGTGLSKVHVCQSINKLVKMYLITKKGNVTEKGNDDIPTYCFQKDYDKWTALPKKVTLPKKVMTVTEKGNLPLPKKVPTKTTITKTTITKTNISVEFASFWEAYPKKVGKLAAQRAWNKNKRPGIDKILEAIAQQRASPQWSKDGGQYIPNPSTWLNQGRWDDQPQKEVDEYEAWEQRQNSRE